MLHPNGYHIFAKHEVGDFHEIDAATNGPLATCYIEVSPNTPPPFQVGFWNAADEDVYVFVINSKSSESASPLRVRPGTNVLINLISGYMPHNLKRLRDPRKGPVPAVRIGVLEVRVFKATPPNAAYGEFPPPVMPSWAPTAEEWARPDAVFRFMVAEGLYPLHQATHPPSAAAKARIRRLSIAEPPSVILPSCVIPYNEEDAEARAAEHKRVQESIQRICEQPENSGLRRALESRYLRSTYEDRRCLVSGATEGDGERGTTTESMIRKLLKITS